MVPLSITEAYVVTFPVPLTTCTSMWPFVRERPFWARNELSWRCSPPLSATGRSSSLLPEPSKTLTSADTGLPAASTSPRFVRNAFVWAICWRLRIEALALPAALPMN